MQARHQIQSRAFRATLSQFTSTAPHPQVKQLRTSRIVLGDVGNFPLIMANTVGGIALTTFGLRKLFFHPDVAIAEVNRFSDEIQNETPQRMESSHQFREQTRFFATVLQPISSFIISTVTGTKQGYGDERDKWALAFVRRDDLMSPPLEATDAFDDGLFTGIAASDFAKNELDEYAKTKV